MPSHQATVPCRSVSNSGRKAFVIRTMLKTLVFKTSVRAGHIRDRLACVAAGDQGVVTTPAWPPAA
jgi:hypothetical protein